MEENKYSIGYFDEEEVWKLTARNSLKDDFNIYLIDVPIDKENIWPFIVDKELDAIIVDFRLFESGQIAYDGNVVVSEIHKHNEHFPIFIMTSYEEDAIENCEDVLIVRGKETLTDPERLKEFKMILLAAINSYHRREDECKDIIMRLQQKLANNETLSLQEEEDRFKAERYLSELNKDARLGTNMLTSSYSAQLKSILDAANEIVESLKNK